MLETETEALARNDRYLLEFVEKLDLCPYAKRCRETGALERRVFTKTELALEETVDTLVELSGERFAHVEVALLIFPRVAASFQAFERFAAQVRSGVEARSGRGTYFIIPFHPDSPPDSDTPNRLVSLLRRSPDPTLQLVRASLLEHVRGGVDPEDTVYIPSAMLQDGVVLPPPAKSVSHLIGDANFETARRVGAERLIALLSNIRASR